METKAEKTWNRKCFYRQTNEGTNASLPLLFIHIFSLVCFGRFAAASIEIEMAGKKIRRYRFLKQYIESKTKDTIKI